ncbi:MAG: ATP-binding protein [Proteobacteria bacterium]|nr:ATP-binding protein [Pseudomonadota bacterium]
MHVLINLIENAVEAMSETPEDQRQLTLSLYCDDESVTIEVGDRGEGISEEAQKKIFVHGYTTKKHGHGFGLHNSANFMAEMGGELRLKSEGENKGATFILKFEP